MDISNLRLGSSMGRLDSMQALVSAYQTPEDVLLDLARHALTISVNAKVAQFNCESESDKLCKMACDFQCHYDKIARRLQIKNRPVIVIDVGCCDFQSETSITPQLLSMVSDMQSCLEAGYTSLTDIGDKTVIGKIAACLDEDIYCLTQCLTNPAS